MKLYTDEEGTAPSPRRVRMYLAEKAIAVPYEELELHRANRTPEFRRKNPIGTLPVLELEDGRCISESIAICRYFEELHPHPTLFGSTPQERADVEMWTRRVEHYLYLPIDLAGLPPARAERAQRRRRSSRPRRCARCGSSTAPSPSSPTSSARASRWPTSSLSAPSTTACASPASSCRRASATSRPGSTRWRRGRAPRPKGSARKLRIHLDTDFGGDPDDACALALLLASGAELVGITTNLDPGGLRAGCVAHYLKRAGRTEIPVAAGAGASLTTLARHFSTAADPGCWPEPVTPAPAPPGAALDLLCRSIEGGASVVAIGAATNLALLEVARPGALEQASVVFMGGWIEPPAAGLPAWGPEMDWNVQCDTDAARILAAKANLTLVTLPATLTAHLRAAHLPRLRASGPVGELLALQSEVHARTYKMTELGRAHAALPDDLLNFHYDPVTCAVALGWPGATLEEMRLRPVLDGGVVRFERDESGRPARVVTAVDGEAFSEMWLGRIEGLRRPTTASET